MPYREIEPGVLSGEFSAPPSKSISHRMLILAALSRQKCRVTNILQSEDTHITLTALQNMGFDLSIKAQTVSFSGIHKASSKIRKIYLGNSGTSARLLTACASILPGKYVLEGSTRLHNRPMQPLVQALKQLGARIEHHGGNLPFQIQGGEIDGGEVEIDASQSSQFLSALLFIGPLTHSGLTLIPLGHIASRPYVDLTIALMQQSGVQVYSDEGKIHIPGGQSYQMTESMVEGDYSSASYFCVGAAISGGNIRITNLNQNSVQGDRLILDILGRAGARVDWQTGQVTVGASRLTGIDEDMNQTPDLVPTVAALALFCHGETCLRNIAHLRFKESDRLQALVENISRLSGDARITGENLVIRPRALQPAALPSYDDHRIAMSFALAGLRIPGIRIENPECVEKSYPEFWVHFDRLAQKMSDRKKPM